MELKWFLSILLNSMDVASEFSLVCTQLFIVWQALLLRGFSFLFRFRRRLMKPWMMSLPAYPFWKMKRIISKCCRNKAWASLKY